MSARDDFGDIVAVYEWFVRDCADEFFLLAGVVVVVVVVVVTAAAAAIFNGIVMREDEFIVAEDELTDGLVDFIERDCAGGRGER